MSAWPKDELDKIAGTDDLHISPFRDDGKTRGTPTWIWSAVVGKSARAATVKIVPRHNQ